MTKSLILKPGTVISVPDLWTKSIRRIDQLEFDSFQITLGEQDAEDGPVTDVVMVIDTNGYDRIPEPEPDYSTGTARRRLVENVESLPLEVTDRVSIMELGRRGVGSVVRQRIGWYRIELIQKYQASVIVDIVTDGSVHLPVNELVDMLGNVLHVGDMVAIADMHFGNYANEDGPELIVRAISEIDTADRKVLIDYGGGTYRWEEPARIARVRVVPPVMS
jgi:hypothetical protein